MISHRCHQENFIHFSLASFFYTFVWNSFPPFDVNVSYFKIDEAHARIFFLRFIIKKYVYYTLYISKFQNHMAEYLEKKFIQT